jgi:hypothetical protein
MLLRVMAGIVNFGNVIPKLSDSLFSKGCRQTWKPTRLSGERAHGRNDSTPASRLASMTTSRSVS